LLKGAAGDLVGPEVVDQEAARIATFFIDRD
jgi:hypothetical protein